jgi:hypothetical protein
MSEPIEIITVTDTRRLPKRHIPFKGTAEQARDAILKDRENKPEDRKYPEGITAVYEYVSQITSWWRIVAIPIPETKEEKPQSILVDCAQEVEVVNG